MPDLAEFQRLFCAAIADDVGTGDALGLVAGAQAEARLAIYQRMYRDRLVDVISEDYPKLARLRSAEWRELLLSYLRACPPAHPDIRDVGRRLAAFMARTDHGWAADLARLEWARSDVFFAHDATPLVRASLEATKPEQFPDLTLQLVPAHAIVELGSNADDIWSAIEDGTEPPEPTVDTRTVVVWRRGFTTVAHRRLEVDEVPCIKQLAKTARFAEICAALSHLPDPAARAVELLLRWTDAELLARP